jgi:hypothetical protein
LESSNSSEHLLQVLCFLFEPTLDFAPLSLRRNSFCVGSRDVLWERDKETPPDDRSPIHPRLSTGHYFVHPLQPVRGVQASIPHLQNISVLVHVRGPSSSLSICVCRECARSELAGQGTISRYLCAVLKNTSAKRWWQCTLGQLGVCTVEEYKHW